LRILSVSAAVSSAVAIALAIATACTSNLLTPIGSAPEDAAVEAAGGDGAAGDAKLGDATKDTYVPLVVGDAVGDAAEHQEGGAGSVDGGEVSPFGGSDGSFHFSDAPFFCGGVSCDPISHYCLHILPEGGLTPEAGDLSDMCLRLPAVCGGRPSCACVVGAAPCDAGVEGEGCVEGAGVDVSCPSY
jgi:hypothetical protein